MLIRSILRFSASFHIVVFHFVGLQADAQMFPRTHFLHPCFGQGRGAEQKYHILFYLGVISVICVTVLFSFYYMPVLVV